MKLLGNIIWWIFGGLTTAIEYATIGLALCVTIIGIPWGIQCFKLAIVMLFPFHADVSNDHSNVLGCIANIIWILIGGIWIALTHLLFGIILFVTIIGIPFANKHFTFAKLALTPFGRDIDMSI